MPRFPKAQKRPDNTPSFLITAKSIYGEAFGPRRQADLAESMADWAELTDAEQSFTLAHLQYLSLVAQAGTQRLLVQVCELLSEIEDGVSEALDEAVEAVQSQQDTIVGEDEVFAADTSQAEFTSPAEVHVPPSMDAELVEKHDESDEVDDDELAEDLGERGDS